MLMKPIIGICPLVDIDKDSYWMLPGYMEGIEMAGAIPVMLPLTDNLADIKTISKYFNGFLFSGGHDISPSLYHAERLNVCGECLPLRDTMEKLLLEEVLKLDKPILGICRGIQLINVVLGGTLYQDIPSQIGTNLEHHQNPPYNVPIHKVILKRDTPLYDLLRKDTLNVNSYHHQGIQKLSPKMKVMAKASDGLIEAIYLPENKFVWAVQWHPEFSYKDDIDALNIFKAFVKSC